MLKLEEKKALLKLSRQTLESIERPDIENVLTDFAQHTQITEALLELSPCFVTLLEKNGRLRGCIGCLETYNSLYRNVFYFTQQAALHDPRFDPVIHEELSNLKIHIAVLGPSLPLASPKSLMESLTIGKHGLVVEHNGRRGVLLASVAVEQHWTKEEFIRQTCYKAGLEPDKSGDYDFSYFEEVSFGEEH